MKLNSGGWRSWADCNAEVEARALSNLKKMGSAGKLMARGASFFMQARELQNI